MRGEMFNENVVAAFAYEGVDEGYHYDRTDV